MRTAIVASMTVLRPVVDAGNKSPLKSPLLILVCSGRDQPLGRIPLVRRGWRT